MEHGRSLLDNDPSYKHDPTALLKEIRNIKSHAAFLDSRIQKAVDKGCVLCRLPKVPGRPLIHPRSFAPHSISPESSHHLATVEFLVKEAGQQWEHSTKHKADQSNAIRKFILDGRKLMLDHMSGDEDRTASLREKLRSFDDPLTRLTAWKIVKLAEDACNSLRAMRDLEDLERSMRNEAEDRYASQTRLDLEAEAKASKAREVAGVRRSQANIRRQHNMLITMSSTRMRKGRPSHRLLTIVAPRNVVGEVY